jgi:multidrug efflux pump subunit AcrB
MIFDASNAHQAIYDTINKAEPDLQAELDINSQTRDNSFQSFVIYLLISPYGNEKLDLLNIVKNNYVRELEKNNYLVNS